LEEHHLENIVGLFQLRYLNLSKTRIRKLPERIGRLGCLETLEVRGTNVKELPTSIVNLKQLAHIHVDLAVKFPDGIMKMQALETFKDVFACRQPFHFLWGLGHLKNLRHLALHFQGEDANLVRENREEWKAIISSLCKLGTKNLRSLTIWEGSSFLQEHLCMHTLEKLITWYSPVPQVPKWFSSLRNLRQLRLQVEEVKQNDICILGALPALLILHLMETTGSSEKLRFSGEIGFQFLRNFNYCANCHSVDLMFSAGSMPRLEKLALIRLVIVEAHSLDIGIEKLPSLITVECEVIGKCGIIEAVRTAVERTVKTQDTSQPPCSNLQTFTNLM
jgi:disease resistance protein RPM1